MNSARSMTPGRIAIAAAFALSCFGLLLFLWLSFGGASPLKPKSYRIDLKTREALGLVSQADVRISGVSVGEVASFERDGSLTDVTIEIDPQYAPRPVDTRAVLRQKTLLGETYVELTPGSPDSGLIPEDGTLAEANVESTVRIDQLLKTFDARTRDDIRTWLTSLDGGLRGSGADLNASFGSAGRTAVAANGVLGVLDGQRDATRRLVRDSGVVFGAIGNQEAAVRGLISSGERLLYATAARDAELAETLRILPTFLRELRPAMGELDRTTDELDPVVSALGPVAATLKPTLADVRGLRPRPRGNAQAGGAAGAGVSARPPGRDRHPRRGTPADGQARPAGAGPAAGDPVPEAVPARADLRLAEGRGDRPATLPDPSTGEPLHYLRLQPVVGPQSLIGYPGRIATTNRHNPYNSNPKSASGLRDSLEAFHCRGALDVPLLNVPCEEQPPPLIQGETHSFPRLKRGSR